MSASEEISHSILQGKSSLSSILMKICC